MEELEKKLHSNNPILVTQIVASLVNSIKQKKTSGFNENKITELKFLKSKCFERDSVISEICGLGITQLIEDGVLQLDSVFKELMTSISTSTYLPSFIKIIGNFLHLEVRNNIKSNQYVFSYNLYDQRHPFVTLLKHKPACANLIVNEIHNFFNYKDQKIIYLVSELFKPVYLYSLFDESVELGLLKTKLWSFINECEYNQSINLNDYFIKWVNIRNTDSLLTNSEILSNIINSNKYQDKFEICILWQTTLLYYIIWNQFDPLNVIYTLKKSIEKCEDLLVSNCLMVILAKIVRICSPLYLLNVLKLCDVLVKKPSIKKYSLSILNASLLQWMANPNRLITESVQLANKIFNRALTLTKGTPENSLFDFEIKYRDFLLTNSEAFLVVQFCSRIEQEKQLLDLMQNISNCSYPLLQKIIHIIYGLFIEATYDEQLTLELFNVMFKFAQYYKNSASDVIVLILYKLTTTKNPNLHIKLLKIMSKLVYTNEDMKKVIITLQVFCDHDKILQNFGLILMLEAWKVNDKCFYYLEKQIIQDNSKFGDNMDWFITKSFVLRELCKEKPEVYGKDIVVHLSNILNKSTNPNYTLPCVLAIEGITFLCKAGVVDIITTWSILEPMFRDDKRVQIIQKLCNLLAEVPNLPYFEAYTDEQIYNFVKILWNYVTTSCETKIIESALKALTFYDLEQISSHFPESFLDEDVLKAKKASNSQQLFYIPGNAWIKFLESFDEKNLIPASEFIVNLMSKEISSYKKYIYEVNSAKEPFSFDYLPNYSVVRGIGEFVRTKSTKWKSTSIERIFLICLEILSREYSKQLPPLNWCFIQELYHENESKFYCIDLASHQVMLSGSARRFMENVISINSEIIDKNIIISIYKNLKYLANSIQPVNLQPFLQNSFNFSINDKELLNIIIEELKFVLKSKNIEDTNKYTIANVLIDKLKQDTNMFLLISPCINVFPAHFFEKLNFLNELGIEIYVKLICSVVRNSETVPLSWINDYIIINKKLIENKSLVLNELIPVLKKHKENDESTFWLLNLMGQIQTYVAHENPMEDIIYLIDIFIMSIVVFSEYDLFLNFNEIIHIFPQACSTLIENNFWRDTKTQIFEWLYFMNTEQIVPGLYRKYFGKTLQALRHNNEFVKNNNWMKYIHCEITQ